MFIHAKRCLAIIPALLAVLAFVSIALAVSPPAAAQSGTACDLDIGFVLDRSGSMNGPPAVAAREGVISFVSKLSASKDQSGLRSFPETLQDKGLNNNHAATADAAAAEVTPIGSDTQASAMDKSRADIIAKARSSARQVMVVYSDGYNGDSAGVANGAKGQGIRIFSVAIGDSNIAHMKSIASDPKEEHFFHINTPQDARDVTDILIALLIDCGPQTQFAWNEACAKQPTTFIDQSVSKDGKKKSSWDFGDGTVVTLNPFQAAISHTYATAGTYTVSMTLTDNLDYSSTKNHTVVAKTCPPTADFDCKWLIEPANYVEFTDKSTDGTSPINGWLWEFADGETSLTQHPSHIYQNSGWKNVKLTVTAQDGTSASITQLCKARGNTPPAVSAENMTEYESQYGEQEFPSYDADGDPITFTFEGTLPGGWYFDNGKLYGYGRSGTTGTWGPFIVTVSDGFSSTQREFMLVMHPWDSPTTADADSDGVPDEADNCASVSNPSQSDHDGDGVGDDCQTGSQPPPPPQTAGDDRDNDGITDFADNCPDIVNPKQQDMDSDNVGDVCDTDVDGDLVPNTEDNCPLSSNVEQTDSDRDFIGDACDPNPLAASKPVQSIPNYEYQNPAYLSAGDVQESRASTPVFVSILLALAILAFIALVSAGVRAKRRG